MPIFGVIAAIGLAVRVVGGIVQARGARKQYQGQSKIEDARNEQMQLEARRLRREQIRQGIMARSVATSNAVNQGAQYGTGLAGGQAQIFGQTNRNLEDITQNEAIGSRIFDLNKQVGQAQTTQYIGSGLSSLGDSLIQNASTIARIGGQGP